MIKKFARVEKKKREITLAHDGNDVEYTDGQISSSSLIVRHFISVPRLAPRSHLSANTDG